MSVSEAQSLTLIMLYSIEFVIAAFTFVSLTLHLKKRALAGAVSGFMASLWLFMFFFSMQMIVSVALRTKAQMGTSSAALEEAILLFWMASHLGTTTFLILVGVFVITKRFDIYIITKSGGKGLDLNKNNKEE